MPVPLTLILAALLASADIAGPDISPRTLADAFVWLGGFAALCVVANQVMCAWLNFRKLKGSDREADTRYASRDSHNELSIKVGVIEGKVDNLTLTLSAELRDINRSLGRLEGALGTSQINRD